MSAAQISEMTICIKPKSLFPKIEEPVGKEKDFPEENGLLLEEEPPEGSFSLPRSRKYVIISAAMPKFARISPPERTRVATPSAQAA